MKIAIVTSVIGSLEKVSQPSIVFKNADYYVFTDQSTEGTIWNKKEIYNFSDDEKYNFRRNAKIYKILPELFIPDYDYYFWVDISHDVIMDPDDICQNYVKDGLFGNFKHDLRSCIYSEAAELKQYNYDHHDNIDRQVAYYKSIGYPENNGLWELSAFYQRSPMISFH